MAASGGSPNVSGSNTAIVTNGPTPGSTPMAVPTKTPSMQYARFVSVNATAKPSERLAKKVHYQGQRWRRMLSP